MPILILLGAAGGALRGLLDAYNRILDWQADRSAYRQLPAGEESEPPRVGQYFDPVAAPVAALAHSLMGAVVAVLVGITGQINGAFAAILVGISAPAILTQLGRIPPVSNAVTGASPEGTGVEGDAAPQPGTASQCGSGRPGAPIQTIVHDQHTAHNSDGLLGLGIRGPAQP